MGGWGHVCSHWGRDKLRKRKWPEKRADVGDKETAGSLIKCCGDWCTAGQIVWLAVGPPIHSFTTAARPDWWKVIKVPRTPPDSLHKL